MSQPPLRLTGFLCAAVAALLVGLIVRNALREDDLALPPVTEQASATPTPAPTRPDPATAPRREPPKVPYDATESGEGEGGERVTPPADGTRRDGSQPLKVVPEGFALKVPAQAKRSGVREGPTFRLSIELDNQPDFLTVNSRTIYPWTAAEDLLNRYGPYSEEPRVTTEGGVDFDAGGNRWSVRDDKLIAIARGERLYVIEAAGFGKDFPEQVTLVNGFSFLELPTHSERLKERYKLTDEQLLGAPPADLEEKTKALAEKIQVLGGGLPEPVRKALDFYGAGGINCRDMLLLEEFFQVVADFIAQSMRKH